MKYCRPCLCLACELIHLYVRPLHQVLLWRNGISLDHHAADPGSIPGYSIHHDFFKPFSQFSYDVLSSLQEYKKLPVQYKCMFLSTPPEIYQKYVFSLHQIAKEIEFENYNSTWKIGFLQYLLFFMFIRKMQTLF